MAQYSWCSKKKQRSYEIRIIPIKRGALKKIGSTRAWILIRSEIINNCKGKIYNLGKFNDFRESRQSESYKKSNDHLQQWPWKREINIIKIIKKILREGKRACLHVSSDELNTSKNLFFLD